MIHTSFLLQTKDFHVHCGQFADTYYQPADVVEALYQNNVTEFWISSTTSCISWSSEEEKQYILNHIDDEIKEAVFTAEKYGMNITPLYWVLPQRHEEGESVESVMNNSSYKGFKIHTRIGAWDEHIELMHQVCRYAEEHNLPILIHTGVDVSDSPLRFEKYFGQYTKVKFVLAHCKKVDEVIGLFSKYENVYGDIAFCPFDCYEKMLASGFVGRLQFGTDFPITHWSSCENPNRVVSLSDLILSYSGAVKEIEKNFNI